MELSLRSLTVLSDTLVALTFEDGHGEQVIFRFETTVHGGITVTNGDDAFNRLYRCVPGPAFPRWPESLVATVLQAHHEPLPKGETLAQITDEYRRGVGERWEAERGPVE